MAVAPPAPNLLIEPLCVLGEARVSNGPNIGLVDPHPKRRRCDDKIGVALRPRIENLLPFRRVADFSGE